jgi:hypothetical protein
VLALSLMDDFFPLGTALVSWCIGGLTLDLEWQLSIKVGLCGADDLGMRTRTVSGATAGAAVVVGLLAGLAVSGCGVAVGPSRTTALGAVASPTTSTTVVLPVCTTAQNPFGVPVGTTCQAYQITFVLSQVGTDCSDLANLLGYGNGTTVKVSGSSGQQVAVGALGAPLDKVEPLIGGGTTPACVFGSSFDIPAGQTAYTFTVGSGGTPITYTSAELLGPSSGFSTYHNGFLAVGIIGGSGRNNVTAATQSAMFSVGANEASGST